MVLVLLRYYGRGGDDERPSVGVLLPGDWWLRLGRAPELSTRPRGRQ